MMVGVHAQAPLPVDEEHHLEDVRRPLHAGV